ncbi:uncharacterized protein [Nicotiana tomentosiformis]|uniref:uncharacterized protein n=1 Tax=Nicotiana tomentosiformis TaxID=4098 RepID=UPI00388C673D
MGSLSFIPTRERPLALDVQSLANKFVRLDISEPSRVLTCVVSRSSLFERIKEWQYDDPHLLVLKDTVQHSDAKEVAIGDDRLLRLHGQICVPNLDGLRELILKEPHSSRYSIHSGVAKMYHIWKKHYWRWRIKKDIVEYVAQCLNYQQVKYAQQRLGSLLQWDFMGAYDYVGAYDYGFYGWVAMDVEDI